MLNKQQFVELFEKGKFNLLAGLGKYDVDLSDFEMVHHRLGEVKIYNLYKKESTYILAVCNTNLEFLGFYEYKIN